MIRFLDGLALLKEVDCIEGASMSSDELKACYPDDIVVIRHNSYIYRRVLCDVTKEQVTRLDDYVSLGDFIENVNIQKRLVSNRINFMEKTNSRFFDYTMVCNMYFIKLDDEFKHLFQYFQPFLANLSDAKHVEHCKLLGDLKIGFY